MELEPDELDRAAGFLIRDGNVTWFAIRARKWRDVFSLRGKQMLDELRKQGLLWATENNATQCKVRKKSPKDRVYRIRLPGL